MSGVQWFTMWCKRARRHLQNQSHKIGVTAIKNNHTTNSTMSVSQYWSHCDQIQTRQFQFHKIDVTAIKHNHTTADFRNTELNMLPKMTNLKSRGNIEYKRMFKFDHPLLPYHPIYHVTNDGSAPLTLLFFNLRSWYEN